jgi:ribulose-phosphate 3-epimerase
MVKNPFHFLNVLKQHSQNKKVIKISTQIEAFPENNSLKTLQEWLDSAKDIGHLKIGLSLNPETPIKILEPYTNQFDFIQLLSVAPGKQGQIFNPKLLEKIVQTKQKYPNIPLQVDGGINKDNLQTILQAGADNVVIGSAIFSASLPTEALMNLERIENKWKTKL